MTKYLLRVLKHGGVFIAYKAKLEKICEEMEQIKTQIPEYKIEIITVPFLEENERNLVVVERR
jgi:16S rRNA G527 N7-methylase RsmG